MQHASKAYYLHEIMAYSTFESDISNDVERYRQGGAVFSRQRVVLPQILMTPEEVCTLYDIDQETFNRVLERRPKAHHAPGAIDCHYNIENGAYTTIKHVDALAFGISLARQKKSS